MANNDFVFLVQTAADRAGGRVSGQNLSAINKQVAVRSHQKHKETKRKAIKSKKAVLSAQHDTVQNSNHIYAASTNEKVPDVFELEVVSSSSNSTPIQSPAHSIFSYDAPRVVYAEREGPSQTDTSDFFESLNEGHISF